MRPLAGKLQEYEISVRDFRDRGGPVSQEVHGDTGALNLSDSRHILLLVHGFNNTAEEANGAYAKLISILTPDLLRMRDGPDAIVRIQWPGDAAVGPLKAADALGYPVDIRRAKESAARLRPYLQELARLRGPNFRMSIIAHSLGCRLVLELLKVRPGESRLPVDLAALMAAAVPSRLVERGVGWPAAVSLVGIDALTRTMLKFHSWLDMVLGLAFPAGQSLAYIGGIEPGEFLEAVGYWGDPMDFAVNEASTHNTHGAYWSDVRVKDRIIEALDASMPAGEWTNTPPDRSLPPTNVIASRNLNDRPLL